MRKKKIHPGDAKSQWVESAKERLFSFTLAGDQIRGALVLGNRMIREMQANHDLGVLESLVLGHAYLGAILMTVNLKGSDRISFQVECSGPIKGFNVESNAFGEVRGFLKQVPIPIDEPLKNFDLSPFFGAGFITITKSLQDAKNPFSGQVMIKHGSIAKDLTNYYWTSEQVPSAFNLSVQFDRDGRVTGAGGLFLQVMPDSDEEMVINIENKVREMPSLGKMFSKGQTADRFLEDYFAGQDLKILGSRKVAFMCHCSTEKIHHMIKMLPTADFDDIRKNGPFPLGVSCHYCGTQYNLDKEVIERIYQKRIGAN